MDWSKTWEERKNKLKTMDVNDLKSMVKECETDVFSEKMEWFCPNHPLEVPFYTYYEEKEVGQLSDIGIHKMYYELGRRKAEEGCFEKAIVFYHKALEYNPVDLDILFALATAYRSLENYVKFKEVADRLYNYCFTKMDIAWFYRLQGNYYLEKMQPQVAKNLYEYSNIFFETEGAQREIIYLKKAMGNKLLDASIEEMGNSFREMGIPTHVSTTTLGFAYKIAKQSIEVSNTVYGRQLLAFIYELTGDKEIENELNDLDDRNS